MAAHARASSSCVVSENIPHRMHSHTGVKSVKNLTKQTGKYATTKSQIPNCRWITSKLRTGNPRAFVKKGDPKICVDYLNAKADNAKSLWREYSKVVEENLSVNAKSVDRCSPIQGVHLNWYEPHFIAALHLNFTVSYSVWYTTFEYIWIDMSLTWLLQSCALHLSYTELY